MARLLAVDWDRHEARYVLASGAADGLSIVAAASVPLVDVAEGGNAPHPDVGGSLRAALADHSLARATTLVGVERSSIELLHFTLPPASEAELPEMVANQALRESQLVTEASILDFVSSATSSSSAREVTAAVLSADQLDQITGACQTAGLKPKRLVLRPYAGASLLRHLVPDEQRVCLLVNVLSEEVDLTFLSEGEVIFFRTVRLPRAADPDGAVPRLLTEISRTLIVAAQSQLGDEPIECVYLFGTDDEQLTLAEAIREQIGLPVTTVDPFESTKLSGGTPPPNAGRFAALVGMLRDEAGGKRHAIDFLNPRQAPQPPDRRRIAARLVGLVVAAMLFGGYFVWGQISDLNEEIRAQVRDLREIDRQAEDAKKQQRVAGALRAWEAGNVIWLDELRDLSVRFPSGRDMVVLRMTMSPSSSGGGTILMNGLVRDPAIVVRMEQAVRDRHHDISSKRVQERVREKSYTWHFETSMQVDKRVKSELLSHLPAGQIPLEMPDPGDATPAAEPSFEEGESP